MSTILAARPSGQRGAELLDRVLDWRIPLTWETAAYIMLLVLGSGFRFWDLGARALHHDESLHAYYSYQILEGHGYEHSPLLHGPFQFFGMALTYVLAGGAGDAMARVFPALFGSALIGLPFLFRSHLGRAGAVAGSALIAFSPTLLYYSRFAREDIYAAFFTLGLMISIWRYIAEQKSGYLYAMAAFLSLAFATKENTFITAGIFLVFLDFLVAAHLAKQTQVKMSDRETALPFYFLAFAPIAWLVTALWPVTRGLRTRFGITDRHPAMDILLVTGTLAGPQFAAAIQIPLEAAGISIDSADAQRAVGFPTVISLLGASVLAGLAWNRRLWPAVATWFYVPYVLLFTSFLTHFDGFGSGVWESLDYWLGQHGANRGGQPEFYYLMFFPAYEFLALAFAGPALLFYALRGGWRSWLLTSVTVLALLAFFGADSFGGGRPAGIASAAMLPLAAATLFFAVRGTDFERFLVFWTAASIVAYSLVGERMPWLSVHLTLPLVVLAAHTAGKVLPAGRSAMRSALALRPRAVAATAAAVVAALTIVSIRTAVYATYDHGDVPREFLFYTQTSPDVPDVAREIDTLAVTSGLGQNLRVQVDRAFAWPWAWYLRDYRLTFEVIDSAFRPEPGAVLLVGGPDDLFTESYRGRFEPARRYILRSWFPEDYRGIGQKANLADGIWDFTRSLGRSRTWEHWWDYFIHRNVNPQGIPGVLYVPLEFGETGLSPSPEEPGGPREPTRTPTTDLEGRLIIGGIGTDPGKLSGPVGVALDASGNVLVADSGNSRVESFDARGGFARVAGGPGSEGGQFNQPSDVAVAPDGSIYVTDTWNHRIEEFGPDMAFIGSFGRPTRDLVNPGSDEMWGPRGIAVDAEGSVWVADTGTHRVRKFAADGTPLAAFGSRGKETGQFNEPVGIAVGPDGSLYVADAGNARIQKFGPDLSFVAEFPIAEWSDRNPRNKPYLTSLPDGRLLATDGPHGRVMLVGTDGAVQASVDRAGEIPFFFPAGVAYDPESHYVFVTDGAAGFVARFPLSDFALR